MSDNWVHEMRIVIGRNIAAKVSDYVKAKYGEGLEPDEWLKYWADVIDFAIGEFFAQETRQEINERKQFMSAHSLISYLEELVSWYGKRDVDTDGLLPADQQDVEIANAMSLLDVLKGNWG